MATILGTPKNDDLDSHDNGTADLVLGRAGNDNILAGSGDTVFAGRGDDTVHLLREPGTLGSAFVLVEGGRGDDVISAGAAVNVVALGGPGDDHISGALRAIGGPGDDIIDTALFLPSEGPIFTGGRGHDVFNVSASNGPTNPISNGGVITDFSPKDELHYSSLEGEKFQITSSDDFTTIVTNNSFFDTSAVRLEGHFDPDAFVVTDTGSGTATVTYAPHADHERNHNGRDHDRAQHEHDQREADFARHDDSEGYVDQVAHHDWCWPS